MQDKISLSLYLVTGLLVGAHAHAQTTASRCASLSNNLQALAGTWTYKLSGFVASDQSTVMQPFAASGRFVASIGSTGSSVAPAGVLDITETSSRNGLVTRLETDPGQFDVNSDCSGGSLTLNLSSLGRQFEYHFVGGGFCQLSMVSSDLGKTLTGTAISGAQECGIQPVAASYCCASVICDPHTGIASGSNCKGVKDNTTCTGVFAACTGETCTGCNADGQGGPLVGCGGLNMCKLTP